MRSPYRSASPPAAVPAPETERKLVSVHRVNHRGMWILAAVFAFGIAPLGAYTAGPLLGVIAVAVAVVWIAAHLFTTSRAIALFDHGIERRPWFGAARAIAFDDVVSVCFDFGVTGLIGTRVTDATWTLEDHTGRRVRVTSTVSDAQPLFDAMDRACVKPVMSDAITAFDDGEDLSFGPLGIGRKGVTVKGQYAPWRRVKRIQASPRWIFVRLEGELFTRTTSYASVPYAPIFLNLVDRAGLRVEYIEGFVRKA
jgi:hypothetical protein